MPTDIARATDASARAKSHETQTHASRRFGQPTVPSGAHSVPSVFIAHPSIEQAAFDGRVNVATAPVTGEQQFVPAPGNVQTLYNTTTHERRQASGEEAYRLVRQGWHIMGATSAQPRPTKPLGRL